MAEKEKDKDGCGRCSGQVTAKDKGVQCEVCEVWFHCKCQGISDDTYKVMKKELSLHWYCAGCEKGMAKIMESVIKIQKRQEKLEDEIQKMVQNMIEMKSRVEDFGKDINDLKEEIKSTNTAIEIRIDDKLTGKLVEQNEDREKQLKEVVKEQVDECLGQVEGKLTVVKGTLDEVRSQALQERDRENRACNIIMYNVQESKEKEKELRWKEDRTFVLNMFNTILGVNIREDDIKRFLRLGGKDKPNAGEAETAKERPVLVQFRDRVLKNMVLDSLNKLKEAEDKYKQIIFSHDFTNEERNECRKLVEEAKKRQNEDMSGEFIYRVRGPPGHLRIEKLRKRH